MSQEFCLGLQVDLFGQDLHTSKLLLFTLLNYSIQSHLNLFFDNLKLSALANRQFASPFTQRMQYIILYTSSELATDVQIEY